MPTPPAAEPQSTGVPGLDSILCGGLSPGRFYLLEGLPGSGKTTLSLQFVAEGARRGERALYLTLGESRDELAAVAAGHGLPMDGVEVVEIRPSEASLHSESQYTVFSPAEVELGQTIREILEAVERGRPGRVVLDSLSELRLLAESNLRYRRQVLALKRWFTARGATAIVLDDRWGDDEHPNVESIAHGIIRLETAHPEFGADRRRLRVVKYRGVDFVGGYHDYRIKPGGLEVYQRLVARLGRGPQTAEVVSTGQEGFDRMLGGGLRRGSSVLVNGAAGTGKSTLAAAIACAAFDRGERAALYLFDESAESLRLRGDALGLDMTGSLATGAIALRQIDPAELTPGEFMQRVYRDAVDDRRSVLVIDSLNGFMNAMPDDHDLPVQLHEMLTLLGQHGVLTILVSVQAGLIGPTMSQPIDASYLADVVVTLRYFEANGSVRQAVSIIKNRGAVHERTIREFRLEAGGFVVGEPLRHFHGVLTGVPTFVGTDGDLLSAGPA